jgi:hypothetical protein
VVVAAADIQPMLEQAVVEVLVAEEQVAVQVQAHQELLILAVAAVEVEEILLAFLAAQA